ncbi:hypothetical protein AC249_AIPGENE8806 [Exaiptasia diaphana]|nr:hypothetical protein AC249_AIPGENE8806 [Exaiptasia diaphana]
MYVETTKSFLFTLYNTNGYQPNQLNLTGLKNQYAMYGAAGYGPTFGVGNHDIYISNLASSNTGSYTRPYSYQAPDGCSSASSCTVMAGTYNFKPTDIEVFYHDAETRGLTKSTILNGRENYINALNSYLATAIPAANTSKWTRCWHAAEDGWDTRLTFHPQCDGKKATVTIIRVGSYVFGGFTDKSWHSGYIYVTSSKSFLFSLYNTNGYQPIMFNLTGQYNHTAIFGDDAYGPTFGYPHDIYIANLARSSTNSYTLPGSYQPPVGCSYNNQCTFMAGTYNFKPDDIEVFYYAS